jgi:tricorn protease
MGIVVRSGAGIRPMLFALAVCLTAAPLAGQGTRLLRQPSLSATEVVFAHGGDLWVASRAGGVARRLTSTPAVESEPHFSPDGRWIAFTSNRSGTPDVYVVPAGGGTPTRLTWYPAPTSVRGWTRDGARVVYASTRQTAPSGYERLWTVAREGGPSEMLPAPWAHDGSFSPDGDRLVVDRVSRWDWEFRSYRGGQNTPLTILDLEDLSEVRLPNERTTDRWPVWMDGTIYFVSDRDWAMNVWAYDVGSGAVRQVTSFDDADIKWMTGHADGTLALEHDGFIKLLEPVSGAVTPLEITVRGDFPWTATRWEDVSDRVASAGLSPTGERVVMEARGEIFTVPTEDGDTRNLSRSSGAADRAPVWSPDGATVAWFSDDGDGYQVVLAPQDGLGAARRLSIGESVMAWEVTWSPDGRFLAFVDDDVRIRVLDVESGDIRTADVGGTNLERGSMGLTWSPDSRWLAYARTHPNHFRRITVWNRETGEATPLSDAMADARSPAWDRDGRHLYFLASTDLGLGSGWANTSSIVSSSSYGAYVAVLRADDPTPFPPESDEEPVEVEGEATEDVPAAGVEPSAEEADGGPEVIIDFDGFQRRIIALPLPRADYYTALAGPAGSVFIGERDDGPVLHKFSLEERDAVEFARGAAPVDVSADGEHLLLRAGPNWQVVGTARPPEPGAGSIDVALRMQLDRRSEWAQMFDEAWRYERDFFYDPGMHGNDWDEVRDRYRPLVPHIQHRADLTYVLDQVNGELSVGHSFVFGGDYPAVDTSRVGLLGADLEAADGRWRIARIYTYESWNPELTAPLDRPGLPVSEGDYLVGVNGVELTDDDDPYRALDGTAGVQTVLHVNDEPSMEGHRTVTVEPIRSENALRQRAWVEDNRRRVDELSGGRLAYVWVPNTGGPGVVSFNRYFFAQQDKEGAVIDERFNGGGNLDDYMVDYMTRDLRGAITNEVPDGRAILLPQGVLGPKVLLINELAGSGGDYFPWAFRQQRVGPLVGTRTWGGLVKSSVHYPLIDGGALTAPDNAVFDPVNREWVAENEGVPPDIEVLLDARSVAQGRDPQLERAVQEALRLLEENPRPRVTPPPFPAPARRPGGND